MYLIYYTQITTLYTCQVGNKGLLQAGDDSHKGFKAENAIFTWNVHTTTAVWFHFQQNKSGIT